jgi:hypothetical protein
MEGVHEAVPPEDALARRLASVRTTGTVMSGASMSEPAAAHGTTAPSIAG